MVVVQTAEPELYALAPSWATIRRFSQAFPVVKFLVLALFYGDYPELAQRCGTSLRLLWNTGRVDMRIGLNEVAPRVRQMLQRLLPGVDMVAADPQIYKNPMLRRLAFEYRGDATHMMWFDDDSCLLPGTDVPGWLRAVTRRAATAQGSLGSLYTQPLTAAHKDWIRAQPWYTGREIPDQLLFSNGGWRVLPLALMRKFDWPPPELAHAGGDLSLGALLQQQGLLPEAFRMGLAIGADLQLRESAAPRRGVTESGQAAWRDIWAPQK